MLKKSPVRVRASSLGELFDCPHRWEAKHILGVRLPSSAPAALGTAIHRSTAAYDKAAIEGLGLEPDEAFAAAVDYLHKPNEDIDWDRSSPSEAEKIARVLHFKYCTRIAPSQNYAAVEVKCQNLELVDLSLILTGTTDRVRQAGNGYGICDIKTGTTAVGADGTVETAGHAYQIGMYELLARATLGQQMTGAAQIIGLQTGKTDKAQRVGIGEIFGASDALLGDAENPGILHHAAEIIHDGRFFGNPNSTLCAKAYCPIFSNCNFRM